jgi:hypothetical protein
VSSGPGAAEAEVIKEEVTAKEEWDGQLISPAAASADASGPAACAGASGSVAMEKINTLVSINDL